MSKDRRYKTIKVLIEGGHISTFGEIFDHIPKTNVGKDLGIHFNRFNRMITKTSEIKIGDLFLLSSFFEVDSSLLFKLIQNQNKKV